jgi:hypothetical protein
MKIQREYTGKLKAGDRLQNKSDGNIITIEEITKYNGVWAAKVNYVSSQTKMGQTYMANAYDMETDIYLKGIWKKI